MPSLTTAFLSTLPLQAQSSITTAQEVVPALFPVTGTQLSVILPTAPVVIVFLIGAVLGVLATLAKLLISLNTVKRWPSAYVVGGMLLTGALASFIMGSSALMVGAHDAILIWSTQVIGGWAGPIAFSYYTRQKFGVMGEGKEGADD